ncbi:MAG: ZIP family metal transporter [Bacteroidota bacterium]
MNTTDLILLFLSVLASGTLFFLIRNPSPHLLKLILAFSGAFLFALTVLHLMPETYANSGPGIGAWILAGFLIQIILEFFSEGIEHGHVHVHDHTHNRFPLAMMLSLSLHSFLEGMPLSSDTGQDGHGHGLLYGIMLHHAPVAFALTSMLTASGLSNRSAFFYLLIFAAMAPLGAFFSMWAHEASGELIRAAYPALMAIVIGIFLHISTTILFESSSNHRFNLYKMAAITGGGLIGLLAYWS